MKKRNTVLSLIRIGVGGYLLTLLFNGNLMHLGLSIGIIESIRPFLPEFFVALILVAWMIRGCPINKTDVIFWLYLLVVIVLGVANGQSTMKGMLSVIRDLLEPFVLLSIVSMIHLEQVQINRIMKDIRNIFAVFILIGVVVALQQNIMGWEWTSKYFAGYSFWGVNRDASLRIVSGWLGFKSLGTTGSAETFGFYNAFAILFLIYYGYRKKWTNALLVCIAVVNLLLCGMKTPLLVAVLIIFAAVFLPRRHKLGVFSKLMLCLVAAAVFVYLISSSGSWEDSSMYARFVYWRELLQDKHLISLILPMNIFTYAAGAGNTGITGFWDNTFLYLSFSTGIIGMMMVCKQMLYRYKLIQQDERNNYVVFAYLYIILSSFTTCIFFGRNFAGPMFLVIGLLTANARRNQNEKICNAC